MLEPISPANTQIGPTWDQLYEQVVEDAPPNMGYKELTWSYESVVWLPNNPNLAIDHYQNILREMRDRIQERIDRKFISKICTEKDENHVYESAREFWSPSIISQCTPFRQMITGKVP